MGPPPPLPLLVGGIFERFAIHLGQGRCGPGGVQNARVTAWGRATKRKPTILALPQCYRDLDEITLLCQGTCFINRWTQQRYHNKEAEAVRAVQTLRVLVGSAQQVLSWHCLRLAQGKLPIQFYQSSSTHTNPQETPLLLTLIEQTPHTTRPTKPEQTNQHIAWKSWRQFLPFLCFELVPG